MEHHELPGRGNVTLVTAAGGLCLHHKVTTENSAVLPAGEAALEFDADDSAVVFLDGQEYKAGGWPPKWGKQDVLI